MNGAKTFSVIGKKVTGIFLGAAMIAGSAAGLFVNVPAVSVDAASSPAAEYGLMDNVQDGVILHAWQWSFNNIKANMKRIAQAGYTSIQTSVIQQSKVPTVGATNEVWWTYYQPANFTIDNTGNSALGTKAEFTAMCQEAHKYGIHVIVDVVSNHLGNDGDYTIFHGIPDDLKLENDPDCWHENWNVDIKEGVGNAGYDDRNRCINYSLGGLPDLNTENPKVQAYVLNYLKECIDAGADGFRFDTAKHIGTRADNDILNDGVDYNFWDNIIPAAKEYYKNSNTAFDSLYCYGEFLGGGSSDVIRSLISNINLTDDVTGNSIRRAVSSQNAASAAASSYNKYGASADQLVLWAESHDTYSNEDKESTNVSDAAINRTWALVASRSDATALYFARTDGYRGGNIGDICSEQCFNPEVVEVNKFHNIFSGKNEYISYSGKTVYNERGTKGVVISKLDGGGSVSLTANKMADGTYTDHVSGNTFTVSNGKITGTVGNTGIAVVYNVNDINEPEFSVSKLYLNAGKWDKDGATFTACLYNSNSKTEDELEMTASSEAGIYEAALPVGSAWTKVKFQRISADGTKVWNYTTDSYPGNSNCYTITSTTDWSGDIGEWETYSVCDHVYGNPVWTWTGTSSAKATFTCSQCSATKTIAAGITRTAGDTTVTYTASVTFNGQTYTDSKTVEKTDGTLLYLKISEYWKEANAEFAIYTFGGSSEPEWTDMTKIDDSMYYVEAPEGDWTGIIFCRMNPARTENRWNKTNEAGSVKPVWGKTIDLTVPEGSNYFTVDEEMWSYATGTWSTYIAQVDYTVGIAQGIEHGTVGTDKGTAQAGDTVTLTVTPDEGYYLKSLTVKDASNNTVAVTNDKFTMPAGNVTVSAVFEKALKNNSTVSAQNVKLGQSVTLTGAAEGGTAPYTYAFYFRKGNSNDWTVKGTEFGTATTAILTPGTAVDYEVKIVVKDASGNTAEKTFTINVTESLTNKSKVSSTSIYLGKSVNLTGAASGGTAPYTYAYYFRKSGDTAWKVKGTEFGTATTATLTPGTAVNYEVKIVVKDATGKTVQKSFTIKVTGSLTNSSTVSSTNVKIGTTVTLKGAASGGTAPYTYAYYFRKSGETQWKVKGTEFGTETTATLTPGTAVNYEVKIVVKDDKGKTAEKNFTIKVSEPLTNKSTVSSTSITYGKTVTLTGAASGGKGPYTYAFYFRKSGDNDWKVKGTEFDTATTATLTPGTKVKYEVMIKVKDSTGAVVSKQFTVNMK